MSGSTFYQYVPDSIILAKTVDEIQLISDSQKNGPVPKGNPITDLNLSNIEEFPANIKFVSNNENKILK